MGAAELRLARRNNAGAGDTAVEPLTREVWDWHIIIPF